MSFWSLATSFSLVTSSRALESRSSGSEDSNTPCSSVASAVVIAVEARKTGRQAKAKREADRQADR